MGATCSTRRSTLNTTSETPGRRRRRRDLREHIEENLRREPQRSSAFISLSPPAATFAASANETGPRQPPTRQDLVLRDLTHSLASQTSETNTSLSVREQVENDQIQAEYLQQELALMEAFFQSVLNGNAPPDGQFNPFAGFAQQEVNPETMNHPTSKRALRQIPTVMVTAEDLVDENNRECCICLDQIPLGGMVSRLPCGHIFHRECITDWLQKNNTCCICRYELETDDLEYERIRKEKMRNRKPRFRDYELQRMSVRELQQWCDRLKIIQNAVEKRGLIDAIKYSGKIDLIAAPKPLEYKISDLRKLSVSGLKKVLNEAGVFFDPVSVVEKEDLVQIFVNSGRLNPIPEDDGTDVNGDDDKKIAHKKILESGSSSDSDVEVISDSKYGASEKNYPSFEDRVRTFTESDCDGSETSDVSMLEGVSMASSSHLSGDASHRPSTYEGVPSSTQPSLAVRTISELKSFARELGIDIHDCVEKREIVERIANAFSDSDSRSDGEPARRRRRY